MKPPATVCVQARAQIFRTFDIEFIHNRLVLRSFKESSYSMVALPAENPARSVTPLNFKEKRTNL